MNAATAATPLAPPRDGRSARWDAHRRTRRQELVEATIAAIHRLGPGVAMEDIAAEAGTSKPVVYRHFADRGELWVAVCRHIADRLIAQLAAAVSAHQDPRRVLHSAIEAYLEFIERDPAVYRFVVHQRPPSRSAQEDPVGGLTTVIGDRAGALIGGQLRRLGHDTSSAKVWGHGLVGLVRAAADHWLTTPDGMDRHALAEHLTRLAWDGVAPLLSDPLPDDPPPDDPLPTDPPPDDPTADPTAPR